MKNPFSTTPTFQNRGSAGRATGTSLRKQSGEPYNWVEKPDRILDYDVWLQEQIGKRLAGEGNKQQDFLDVLEYYDETIGKLSEQADRVYEDDTTKKYQSYLDYIDEQLKLPREKRSTKAPWQGAAFNPRDYALKNRRGIWERSLERRRTGLREGSEESKRLARLKRVRDRTKEAYNKLYDKDGVRRRQTIGGGFGRGITDPRALADSFVAGLGDAVVGLPMLAVMSPKLAKQGSDFTKYFFDKERRAKEDKEVASAIAKYGENSLEHEQVLINQLNTRFAWMREYAPELLPILQYYYESLTSAWLDPETFATTLEERPFDVYVHVLDAAGMLGGTGADAVGAARVRRGMRGQGTAPDTLGRVQKGLRGAGRFADYVNPEQLPFELGGRAYEGFRDWYSRKYGFERNPEVVDITDQTTRTDADQAIPADRLRPDVPQADADMFRAGNEPEMRSRANLVRSRGDVENPFTDPGFPEIDNIEIETGLNVGQVVQNIDQYLSPDPAPPPEDWEEPPMTTGGDPAEGDQLGEDELVTPETLQRNVDQAQERLFSIFDDVVQRIESGELTIPNPSVFTNATRDPNRIAQAIRDFYDDTRIYHSETGNRVLPGSGAQSSHPFVFPQELMPLFGAMNRYVTANRNMLNDRRIQAILDSGRPESVSESHLYRTSPQAQQASLETRDRERAERGQLHVPIRIMNSENPFRVDSELELILTNAHGVRQETIENLLEAFELRNITEFPEIFADIPEDQRFEDSTREVSDRMIIPERTTVSDLPVARLGDSSIQSLTPLRPHPTYTMRAFLDQLTPLAEQLDERDLRRGEEGEAATNRRYDALEALTNEWRQDGQAGQPERPTQTPPQRSTARTYPTPPTNIAQPTPPPEQQQIHSDDTEELRTRMASLEDRLSDYITQIENIGSDEDLWENMRNDYADEMETEIDDLEEHLAELEEGSVDYEETARTLAEYRDMVEHYEPDISIEQDNRQSLYDELESEIDDIAAEAQTMLVEFGELRGIDYDIDGFYEDYKEQLMEKYHSDLEDSYVITNSDIAAHQEYPGAIHRPIRNVHPYATQDQRGFIDLAQRATSWLGTNRFTTYNTAHISIDDLYELEEYIAQHRLLNTPDERYENILRNTLQNMYSIDLGDFDPTGDITSQLQRVTSSLNEPDRDRIIGRFVREREGLLHVDNLNDLEGIHRDLVETINDLSTRDELRIPDESEIERTTGSLLIGGIVHNSPADFVTERTETGDVDINEIETWEQAADYLKSYLLDNAANAIRRSLEEAEPRYADIGGRLQEIAEEELGVDIRELRDADGDELDTDELHDPSGVSRRRLRTWISAIREAYVIDDATWNPYQEEIDQSLSEREVDVSPERTLSNVRRDFSGVLDFGNNVRSMAASYSADRITEIAGEDARQIVQAYMQSNNMDSVSNWGEVIDLFRYVAENHPEHRGTAINTIGNVINALNTYFDAANATPTTAEERTLTEYEVGMFRDTLNSYQQFRDADPDSDAWHDAHSEYREGVLNLRSSRFQDLLQGRYGDLPDHIRDYIEETTDPDMDEFFETDDIRDQSPQNVAYFIDETLRDALNDLDEEMQQEFSDAIGMTVEEILSSPTETTPTGTSSATHRFQFDGMGGSDIDFPINVALPVSVDASIVENALERVGILSNEDIFADAGIQLYHDMTLNWDQLQQLYQASVPIGQRVVEEARNLPEQNAPEHTAAFQQQMVDEGNAAWQALADAVGQQQTPTTPELTSLFTDYFNTSVDDEQRRTDLADSIREIFENRLRSRFEIVSDTPRTTEVNNILRQAAHDAYIDQIGEDSTRYYNDTNWETTIDNILVDLREELGLDIENFSRTESQRQTTLETYRITGSGSTLQIERPNNVPNRILGNVLEAYGLFRGDETELRMLQRGNVPLDEPISIERLYEFLDSEEQHLTTMIENVRNSGRADADGLTETARSSLSRMREARFQLEQVHTLTEDTPETRQTPNEARFANPAFDRYEELREELSIAEGGEAFTDARIAAEEELIRLFDEGPDIREWHHARLGELASALNNENRSADHQRIREISDAQYDFLNEQGYDTDLAEFWQARDSQEPQEYMGELYISNERYRSPREYLGHLSARIRNDLNLERLVMREQGLELEGYSWDHVRQTLDNVLAQMGRIIDLDNENTPDARILQEFIQHRRNELSTALEGRTNQTETGMQEVYRDYVQASDGEDDVAYESAQELLFNIVLDYARQRVLELTGRDTNTEPNREAFIDQFEMYVQDDVGFRRWDNLSEAEITSRLNEHIDDAIEALDSEDSDFEETGSYGGDPAEGDQLNEQESTQGEAGSQEGLQRGDQQTDSEIGQGGRTWETELASQTLDDTEFQQQAIDGLVTDIVEQYEAGELTADTPNNRSLTAYLDSLSPDSRRHFLRMTWDTASFGALQLPAYYALQRMFAQVMQRRYDRASANTFTENVTRSQLMEWENDENTFFRIDTRGRREQTGWMGEASYLDYLADQTVREEADRFITRDNLTRDEEEWLDGFIASKFDEYEIANLRDDALMDELYDTFAENDWWINNEVAEILERQGITWSDELNSYRSDGIYVVKSIEDLANYAIPSFHGDHASDIVDASQNYNQVVQVVRGTNPRIPSQFSEVADDYDIEYLLSDPDVISEFPAEMLLDVDRSDSDTPQKFGDHPNFVHLQDSVTHRFRDDDFEETGSYGGDPAEGDQIASEIPANERVYGLMGSGNSWNLAEALNFLQEQGVNDYDDLFEGHLIRGNITYAHLGQIRDSLEGLSQSGNVRMLDRIMAEVRNGWSREQERIRVNRENEARGQFNINGLYERVSSVIPDGEVYNLPRLEEYISASPENMESVRSVVEELPRGSTQEDTGVGRIIELLRRAVGLPFEAEVAAMQTDLVFNGEIYTDASTFLNSEESMLPAGILDSQPQTTTLQWRELFWALGQTRPENAEMRNWISEVRDALVDHAPSVADTVESVRDVLRQSVIDSESNLDTIQSQLEEIGTEEDIYERVADNLHQSIYDNEQSIEELQNELEELDPSDPRADEIQEEIEELEGYVSGDTHDLEYGSFQVDDAIEERTQLLASMENAISEQVSRATNWLSRLETVTRSEYDIDEFMEAYQERLGEVYLEGGSPDSYHVLDDIDVSDYMIEDTDYGGEIEPSEQYQYSQERFVSVREELERLSSERGDGETPSREEMGHAYDVATYQAYLDNRELSETLLVSHVIPEIQEIVERVWTETGNVQAVANAITEFFDEGGEVQDTSIAVTQMASDFTPVESFDTENTQTVSADDLDNLFDNIDDALNTDDDWEEPPMTTGGDPAEGDQLGESEDIEPMVRHLNEADRATITDLRRMIRDMDLLTTYDSVPTRNLTLQHLNEMEQDLHSALPEEYDSEFVFDEADIETAVSRLIPIIDFMEELTPAQIATRHERASLPQTREELYDYLGGHTLQYLTELFNTDAGDRPEDRQALRDRIREISDEEFDNLPSDAQTAIHQLRWHLGMTANNTIIDRGYREVNGEPASEVLRNASDTELDDWRSQAMRMAFDAPFSRRQIDGERQYRIAVESEDEVSAMSDDDSYEFSQSQFETLRSELEQLRDNRAEGDAPSYRERVAAYDVTTYQAYLDNRELAQTLLVPDVLPEIQDIVDREWEESGNIQAVANAITEFFDEGGEVTQIRVNAPNLEVSGGDIPNNVQGTGDSVSIEDLEAEFENAPTLPSVSGNPFQIPSQEPQESSDPYADNRSLMIGGREYDSPAAYVETINGVRLPSEERRQITDWDIALEALQEHLDEYNRLTDESPTTSERLSNSRNRLRQHYASAIENLNTALEERQPSTPPSREPTASQNETFRRLWNGNPRINVDYDNFPETPQEAMNAINWNEDENLIPEVDNWRDFFTFISDMRFYEAQRPTDIEYRNALGMLRSELLDKADQAGNMDEFLPQTREQLVDFLGYESEEEIFEFMQESFSNLHEVKSRLRQLPDVDLWESAGLPDEVEEFINEIDTSGNRGHLNIREDGDDFEETGSYGGDPARGDQTQSPPTRMSTIQDIIRNREDDIPGSTGGDTPDEIPTASQIEEWDEDWDVYFRIDTRGRREQTGWMGDSRHVRHVEEQAMYMYEDAYELDEEGNPINEDDPTLEEFVYEETNRVLEEQGITFDEESGSWRTDGIYVVRTFEELAEYVLGNEFWGGPSLLSSLGPEDIIEATRNYDMVIQVVRGDNERRPAERDYENHSEYLIDMQEVIRELPADILLNVRDWAERMGLQRRNFTKFKEEGEPEAKLPSRDRNPFRTLNMNQGNPFSQVAQV